MHLKQLKLAGFKSFVDPSIVYFPSQLVAVLGPNGCGKSNIIDAVRWVMGESSAKTLRGESMTDVIFNGSSQRKAVGQATVELIFDNSMGRLSGPYASYAEIAVKRVVTRDGDSTFYLNGSRCRRRDITDIFLGTGAGARSYSIIGQGTISRLIEAKPEELRVFLEEAAGVSKYKERRKETSQRMGHTRDNLARVADIREELGTQLQKLERQAKAAERYTQLKAEEKQCKGEIAVIKWRDLSLQQTQKQNELTKLAVNLEQAQAELTHVSSEKTIINEQWHSSNDLSQQVQTQFYQLGTDMARLEENIQQQQREKQRLEEDKNQLQADQVSAKAQVQADQESVSLANEKVASLEEKLHLLQTGLSDKQQELHQAQQQKEQWDKAWQDLQAQVTIKNREIQSLQLTLDNNSQKKQQHLRRIETLKQEQSAFNSENLEKDLSDLNLKLTEFTEQLAEQEQLVTTLQQDELQSKDSLLSTEQQLRQLQDKYHRVHVEHAALKAIQQADAPTDNLPDELNALPKLFDVLTVEKEWQFACETILGKQLHAIALPSKEAYWNILNQHAPTNLIVTNPSRDRQEADAKSSTKTASPTEPLLKTKFKTQLPTTTPQLDTIYTAPTLSEAIKMVPQLSAEESVITPEGYWLGAGWLKIPELQEEGNEGLLARQEKIKELALLLTELDDQLILTRQQRDQLVQTSQDKQSQIDSAKKQQYQFSDSLRETNNQITTKNNQLAQQQKQLAQCKQEQDALLQALEELTTVQLTQETQLTLLRLQAEEAAANLESLQAARSQDNQRVGALQQELETSRILVHQTDLEYDREKSKIVQFNERIYKENERIAVLHERLETLATRLLMLADPDQQLQQQLTEKLAHYQATEAELISLREKVAELKAALDTLDSKAKEKESELRRTQESLGELRLQEQAIAMKAANAIESLTELGLSLQEIMQHLPEELTQSQKEDELLAINEKIKRLGAINLAAIEEYATANERKLYLDAQYNDLQEALLALEEAIRQIDKETTLRLKNTFEEVNSSFKVLFPRLFGGGKAELELTCDNLLEAGVVVMAQPPGKRNSTIHLLSGGEKAMTAVALVFAIFQLNPSPFCMLDEVDAPLDDVNVGRFCEMVKEMSEFVQFLFITHNKVTMEMADHLIGVTMREPGVSRLVAVDVQQALTTE